MLAQGIRPSAPNSFQVSSKLFSQSAVISSQTFGSQRKKDMGDDAEALKGLWKLLVVNKLQKLGLNAKDSWPELKEAITGYFSDIRAGKGEELKTSGTAVAKNTAMPFLSAVLIMAVQWGFPIEAVLLILGSVPGIGKFLLNTLMGNGQLEEEVKKK